MTNHTRKSPEQQDAEELTRHAHAGIVGETPLTLADIYELADEHYKVPLLLIQKYGLGPAVLWGLIRFRCRLHGVCYHSLEQFGELLGVSNTKTVRKYLRALTEAGEIEAEPRPGRSTVYRMINNLYRFRDPYELGKNDPYQKRDGSDPTPTKKGTPPLPKITYDKEPKKESNNKGVLLSEPAIQADPIVELDPFEGATPGDGWEIPRIEADLLDLGVSKTMAARILTKHETDPIEKLGVWIGWCKAKGKAAGYLVAGLQGGWYLGAMNSRRSKKKGSEDTDSPEHRQRYLEGISHED